jgi:hypothetical protein
MNAKPPSSFVHEVRQHQPPASNAYMGVFALVFVDVGEPKAEAVDARSKRVEHSAKVI